MGAEEKSRRRGGACGEGAGSRRTASGRRAGGSPGRSPGSAARGEAEEEESRRSRRAPRTAPKLESLSARNQERPRGAQRGSERSGRGEAAGSAASGAGRGGEGAAAAAAAAPRQQRHSAPEPGEERCCVPGSEERPIGASARPLSLAKRTRERAGEGVRSVPKSHSDLRERDKEKNFLPMDNRK